MSVDMIPVFTSVTSDESLEKVLPISVRALGPQIHQSVQNYIHKFS